MSAIIKATASPPQVLGVGGELEDLAPFQTGPLNVVRVEEGGGGAVKVG